MPYFLTISKYPTQISYHTIRTDKLIYCIIIIEGDEPEAALLPGLLVHDHIHALDVSKVLQSQFKTGVKYTSIKKLTVHTDINQ